MGLTLKSIAVFWKCENYWEILPCFRVRVSNPWTINPENLSTRLNNNSYDSPSNKKTFVLSLPYQKGMKKSKEHFFTYVNLMRFNTAFRYFSALCFSIVFSQST